MIDFNNVSLTYKGHSINITNNIDENRPNFRRVTIFLDDGDYEEVQHVDKFDMNIDSLIETLNKAKELIDWYINANEMLHIKKG
tara:strand:- start:1866 stop:2117 length:252 start_codon:yes stop_codon:yes gene_type:complete